MSSTTILTLVVLTLIVVSCLAIYAASDAVILIIQNFGIKRTKFAFGGLGAIVVVILLATSWWYVSLAKQKAQSIVEIPTLDSAPLKQADAQAGDLNVLVDRLDARLKVESDDAQGWALYARTLFELKRYPDAAKAYQRAVAALPDDAALQIERADAEYMASGQKWTPVATGALQRAIKLAPTNPEALWLAGKERFENKDFSKAVRHWEALERVVAPGSDHARELKTSLVEARALRDGIDPTAALVSAGVSVAPLQAPGAPPAGNAKDALAIELKAALVAMDRRASSGANGSSAASVSGVVSLDAALKTRAAPEDNVFIFARNADIAQAGMPLAILRHRVADLPVRFDLSDNNAMSPEAKLSTAAKVIITARVTKSGDARAQAGDLEGASAPIALGTEKVAVVINRAR